jgi:hypothetical protein
MKPARIHFDGNPDTFSRYRGLFTPEPPPKERSMWIPLLVAAAVAAFGVFAFRVLGRSILNEAETERLELAARGRRCGLNPRS